MFASAESFNWIQALGIAAASLLTKWGVEKAFGFLRPPRPQSDHDAKYEALSRRVDGIEATVSENIGVTQALATEVASMHGTVRGLASRVSQVAASQGD